MKNVEAIKTFFEKDGGRKITMDELKMLGPVGREELGKLACVELGEVHEVLEPVKIH